MGEARALFQQAAAPQGVPVEQLGDPNRVAVIRTYLALIDRAAK